MLTDCPDDLSETESFAENFKKSSPLTMVTPAVRLRMLRKFCQIPSVDGVEPAIVETTLSILNPSDPEMLKWKRTVNPSDKEDMDNQVVVRSVSMAEKILFLVLAENHDIHPELKRGANRVAIKKVMSTSDDQSNSRSEQ